MASFSQPQFFPSLIHLTKNNFTLSSFPTLKTSKILASKSESSPDSQGNTTESVAVEKDPVKLALARAKAYKNSVKSGVTSPEIAQPQVSGKSDDFSTGYGIEDVGVGKDVEIAVKNADEYKKSEIVCENQEVASNVVGDSDVKLALEKATDYKKNAGVDNGGVVGSGKSASGLKGGGNEKILGSKQPKKSNKKELAISSIDFMGLGFADKKSGRGLPAGLVPLSDPFPEGELPEVEIIVGDTSNFGGKSGARIEEEDTDLYKPKVSTWGVFPRPNNISKTYGGGRTLRPGEALETAEEKAVKEARTMQLLAEYKNQFGMNIDPKVKAECEKILEEGDSLMDRGKLKEALPFYESVMKKIPLKSELHGLAALQWSICQDSLNRSNEARVMYEKLQSHPSPKVSKKARQFFFSFQAMEMMKVNSMNRSSLSTNYQNFFDAFVQKKANYDPLKEAEVEEDGLNQVLPYFIFMVSPIFMVLLIAAFRPR